MWIILIRLLLFIGAAVLAMFIVKILLLTLSKVFANVRDRLRRKVGSRVIVASVKRLADELEAERARGKNVRKIDELLAELQGEGVILATMDESGEIDDKEIEILKSEQMDAPLKNTLKRDGDLTMVEA